MIALISDIHGNYTALSEVLKCIDGMGIATIYCLGDIVGYYTEINQCCEELQRRSIVSSMGNHDWYLSAGSVCPRSQSVNDCLRYQSSVISEHNRQWLKSLPLSLQVGRLSMVHGGWSNPIDEYLAPSQNYFDQIEGSLFASGHVHRQCVVRYGYKQYCNPGSVGQPRDGDPRAAFATFDGEQFYLHRVAYDIS